MSKQPSKTRKEALEELSGYGIKGTKVYLIDVIPLIEMIWADGMAQDNEIAILYEYLEKHVAHINNLAGENILTFKAAHSFVSSFLKRRPDPGLLKILRSLISPIRFSTSETAVSEAVRESLLAACIDIATSSVSEVPDGLHDRFNFDEKRCFFEILESFER